MNYSFAPIINKECVVLILGTMPGKESLIQQKYYANTRNQFWKLLFNQFSIPINENYDERCKFLLNQKIAIWDVLHNADREGSLDINIKNGVPNDFIKFFEEYTKLKYLFFNGAKSENLFKKFYKDIYKEIWHKGLPSSSPANTILLENKQTEWGIIISKLNEG